MLLQQRVSCQLSTRILPLDRDFLYIMLPFGILGVLGQFHGDPSLSDWVLVRLAKGPASGCPLFQLYLLNFSIYLNFNCY